LFIDVQTLFIYMTNPQLLLSCCFNGMECIRTIQSDSVVEADFRISIAI